MFGHKVPPINRMTNFLLAISLYLIGVKLAKKKIKRFLDKKKDSAQFSTEIFLLSYFFLLKLAHIEIMVKALIRKKACMITLLDNLAIFQDQNLIRLLNGG